MKKSGVTHKREAVEHKDYQRKVKPNILNTIKR